MCSQNPHHDSIGQEPETEEREPPITDFAAILAIPILLTGIHFLIPDSIKHTFAFSHDQFTLYTPFTAAYIHAGRAHLFNNILAYLLTVFCAYRLCIAVNQRQWFWRTFVVFLLVLPILVSISSYIAFSVWFPNSSPVSRGFSGIAAGFTGFLLVTLGIYVRERYSPNLGIVLGISTFLVLMAIIDYIYAGRVRLVIAGLLGVGILLEVGNYLRQVEIDMDELVKREVFIDAGVIAVVGAVLIYMVITMFPAEISQNGSTTNIVAHALGFLWGVGASLLTKI